MLGQLDFAYSSNKTMYYFYGVLFKEEKARI